MDRGTPSGGYRPAVGATILASESAVVNLRYPESHNFTILYDTGFLPAYIGLQINIDDYPQIALGFGILREYDAGVPHVLTPEVGAFLLQGSAVMNFVPEPATVSLLIAGLVVLRKSRRT
jgi:hypothetical protein